MNKFVYEMKSKGVFFLLFVFFLMAFMPIALEAAERQAEEQVFAKKLVKKLRSQCGRWEGNISVILRQGEGDEQRDFSASLTLSEQASTQTLLSSFEGVLTISQEDLLSSVVLIPLSFSAGGAKATGYIGANSEPLTSARAPEVGDLIDRERILWIGEENHFEVQVTGDTGMDMIISGKVDLPQSIAPAPVVWVSGHLRREGFRIAIGSLFEITLMECLGILATLFFASRFLVQWAASEKAGKSVVPELFWWISLFGGLSMIIYAIYFGRFAVLLGQLTGWAVYSRNIWLIHREKKRLRNQEAEDYGTA